MKYSQTYKKVTNYVGEGMRLKVLQSLVLGVWVASYLTFVCSTWQVLSGR